MSNTHLEKLINMANHIAANLSHQHAPEQAAAAVANHINRFWARPMKDQIIQGLQERQSELEPIALKAVRQLAEQVN
ncbi:formate dehydrogenase subunit delta [Spartinivicinus ruber]|uniref:formate dehydrogenase subunit delta n=1 Tax=Spartinivicinus ruber TaxID=2683272 RepID=UPI0013D35BF1|nr:formate dehydrogenase subunit delta [Spartinivicinus ruber]